MMIIVILFGLVLLLFVVMFGIALIRGPIEEVSLEKRPMDDEDGPWPSEGRRHMQAFDPYGRPASRIPPWEDFDLLHHK